MRFNAENILLYAGGSDAASSGLIFSSAPSGQCLTWSNTRPKWMQSPLPHVNSISLQPGCKRLFVYTITGFEMCRCATQIQTKVHANDTNMVAIQRALLKQDLPIIIVRVEQISLEAMVESSNIVKEKISRPMICDGCLDISVLPNYIHQI